MRRMPRSGFMHNSIPLWLLETAVSLAWGLVKVTYRWNVGAELDGEPRTDATFWERGERALTKTGRASQWSYLPRWKRLVTRHVVFLGVVLTLYGASVAPTLTRLAWGLTVAGAAVWLGVKVRRAMLMREHRDMYVLPLGMTLGPMIGHGESVKADAIEKWLTFPVDFFTNEELPELRVTLLRSVHYDAKLQTAVLKLIADKLGRSFDELDCKWVGVGAAPYISVRMAPRPPRLVTFEDARPLLEKSKESETIMGIAARGRTISNDLDTESPHTAMSAAPGAGKSVWGRGVIADGLHKGWQFGVLDKKRVSQDWCKDLPGVTYCRVGEEMHNFLISAVAELKRRYDLIDRAEDPDNVDVGPRLVVFFEEQNVGMKELKKYWESIRTKDDPKRSPAIDALDEILCAGRQAKMHVMTIAQLFTVQAAGGDPTARENYSTRILARAQANAWKMLAPEAAPFPRLNKHRGRMYIVDDGSAVEFQGIFMTKEEARAWATSGHVTVPAQWNSGGVQRQEPVTGESVTAPAAPALYTLAQAVKLGFVGEIADKDAETRRYNWLRQAKKRAGDAFPEGVTEGGKTKYTEAEIRGWYEASVLESVTAEPPAE